MDLIAGVYTHRETYKKRFLENWNKYNKDIELLYNVKKLPLHQNMESLRQDFIKSKKRYWLFMDDDILFVNNNAVKNAVNFMKNTDRYSLLTIYQCFDEIILTDKKHDKHNKYFGYKIQELLRTQPIYWVCGCFMLVDSKKIGDVSFDQNIPTTNGELSDLCYSLRVQQVGGRVGIYDSYLYHEWKESNGKKDKNGCAIHTRLKQEDLNMKDAERFLRERYPNRDLSKLSMEEVNWVSFKNDGMVDENISNGHFYLKNTYPQQYKEHNKSPNKYFISANYLTNLKKAEDNGDLILK